MDQTNR